MTYEDQEYAGVLCLKLAGNSRSPCHWPEEKDSAYDRVNPALCRLYRVLLSMLREYDETTHERASLALFIAMVARKTSLA